MRATDEQDRALFGQIGSTLPTPWLVGQAVALDIRMTRDPPDPNVNRVSGWTYLAI